MLKFQKFQALSKIPVEAPIFTRNELYQDDPNERSGMYMYVYVSEMYRSGMYKYMKGLEIKSLNFSKATNDIVLSNIQKLNTRKASQLNDILTKYIKKFSNVFTPVITDDYNNCVAIDIFPEFFKTAEFIPSYKKDKATEKTNYRPISILSNISKIYERLMHDNMSDYFNDVLSKFQCGFGKSFGAQNCLLFMIETI